MPTAVSDVQLGKHVTRAVDDYRNDPGVWVADYLAPRIPVPTMSGFLPRFDSTNQKDVVGKLSPYDPSPRVDFGVGSTAYTLGEYRRRAFLPHGLEVADDTGILDMTRLGLAADEALRVEREKEVATKLVDTSNSVTQQSAPATRWDAVGGDPAGTVATAIGTIDDAINRIAAKGLATRDVGLFLRRYVAGLRSAGGNAGMASLAEVADFLGLSELRIIRGGYDSGKPGAGRTGAKVISANKFWVFYQPEQMSAMAPSWMSTPFLSGQASAKVFDVTEPVVGKAVEVYDWRDLVVVDKTACVYILTPLT